jgi:hypothetical protein
MRIYPTGEARMSPDEKEWLMYVYRKRCKHIVLTFLSGFFITVALIYWFGFFLLMPWWMPFPLAVVLSLAASAVHYYYGVLPYKRDAEAGIKYQLPFTVIAKSYYPVTGQYMLQIDGFSRMMEVDGATYNSCAEGGQIPLYMALRSKYLFNSLDSFEVQDHV